MVSNLLRSIIISLISITGLLVFPGVSASQLSGYEILKTEISARAAGMSGAFVGVSGDLYALFYNPAGLIGIQKKTFGFTYLDHVLDIKAGNFVYSSPLGVNSKYAFGINYINYGSFEGRDINGAPTTPFTAQDVVLAGGFAREYSSHVFYGISAKALYSKIAAYSSTVIVFDGGLIYTMPEKQLTFGVSVVNVGVVASAYTDTNDDVPSMLKGGFSKYLAHLPLLISFEFRQFLSGDFQVVGGGEFTFGQSFKGRLGYNSYGSDQKIGDEGGTFAGVSFGFGLNWKLYLIDYSFSSSGVIGNLQRFSVTWTY